MAYKEGDIGKQERGLVWLRIKPLEWIDKSQDRYRMFVAATEVGRIAYGTDIDGVAYHQTAAREVDHANEDLARQAAESEYRDLVLARLSLLSSEPLNTAAYANATASVIELREVLRRYVEECAEARTWGGPTLYPKHPIDEATARRFAEALSLL